MSTPLYRCREHFVHVGEPCAECEPIAASPAEPVGRKLDDGKEPWHLVPFAAARAVVRVLAFGARKYAPNNWRRVENARDRYFSAALRHLVAWHQGERVDPESGLPHLAHAACCVLFLLAPEEEGGAS